MLLATAGALRAAAPLVRHDELAWSEGPISGSVRVAAAGDSTFLRQTFVPRAGHCAITPAETIRAVQSLLFRLHTGVWGSLDAHAMNVTASALGRAVPR